MYKTDCLSHFKSCNGISTVAWGNNKLPEQGISSFSRVEVKVDDGHAIHLCALCNLPFLRFLFRYITAETKLGFDLKSIFNYLMYNFKRAVIYMFKKYVFIIFANSFGYFMKILLRYVSIFSHSVS